MRTRSKTTSPEGARNSNPFHSAPPAPQAAGLAETFVESNPAIRGPVLPPGAPRPAGGGVLTSEGEVGGSTVAVVGVHGGAGASTVRRILAKLSTGPGGLTFVDAPQPGMVPRQGAAILVARTSGVGLDRAHGAAQEWGTGTLRDLALLGLVFVADGPKPTPQLEPGLRRVSRMYPRTWLLPWVPEWHLTSAPALEQLPRPITKIGKGVLSWAAERGLEPTPKEITR